MDAARTERRADVPLHVAFLLWIMSFPRSLSPTPIGERESRGSIDTPSEFQSRFCANEEAFQPKER